MDNFFGDQKVLDVMGCIDLVIGFQRGFFLSSHAMDVASRCFTSFILLMNKVGNKIMRLYIVPAL